MRKKSIIISVNEDSAKLDGAWVSIGDDAAQVGIQNAHIKLSNIAQAIAVAKAIKDTAIYVSDPEVTRVEIQITAHGHFGVTLEKFQDYFPVGG